SGVGRNGSVIGSSSAVVDPEMGSSIGNSAGSAAGGARGGAAAHGRGGTALFNIQGAALPRPGPPRIHPAPHPEPGTRGAPLRFAWAVASAAVAAAIPATCVANFCDDVAAGCNRLAASDVISLPARDFATLR